MATYNKYKPEFKEKGLCLYLEEGRMQKRLMEEYNLESGSITYCLQQRHKECKTNPIIKQ